MEATLVERNRGAGVATVLGWIGVLLATAFAARYGSPPVAAVSQTIYCGIVLAMVPTAIWAAFQSPRRRPVSIGVAGGLSIDGEAVRTRDARIGRLRDGRFRVELREGLLGRRRLEVADEAAARAVLEAVGVDRRKGTTRFRVQSSTFIAILPRAGIGMAAGIAVANLVGLPVIGLPIVLCAFVLAVHSARRVTVTVGIDGIELRTIGRRELYAHADIRSVKRLVPTPPIVVSPGVELELRNGTRHALDTRAERFRTGAWEADPIYDAIVRARARASGGTAAAEPALARGGRSTKEWISAVRALGDALPGYRTAPLDEHTLETVLADATASAEARAAAAVALRARDPARLRIALEDVADEHVRRVALADEEELEAELESLQKS